MSVIHIIDDFSKKNLSIVSVAKLICKNKRIKKSIIFRNKKNLGYFLLITSIINFFKKNKANLIHVHGLWRPIYFFSLILSSIMKINIIIQPHGMLLDQALKNKTFFHYYVKIFLITVYKVFIRNIKFIAVTNEERASIEKFFGKKNIYVIQNPFISTFKCSKKIKKQYVFFGRFNRHKNLHLIVNAFLKANLKDKWKLKIYGLRDDKTYETEIKNLIKKHKAEKVIIFEKPIFEKEKKFEIMASSYMNLIMSKSEILSLSVLEFLSVGVRSVVNNKLKFPIILSKNLIFSQPSIKELSISIRKTAKDFKNNSLLKRKKIVSDFKSFYDFNKIENKYYSIYSKLSN